MSSETAEKWNTDSEMMDNSLNESFREEESDEESESEEKENIEFEIMTYPADTTLKGYKEQWDNNQLKIPPFQRDYIWDQSRASRLIESFLLGLAVPGVFLYRERNRAEYLVIDGQQRIRTVVSFLNEKFNNKKFTLKKVSPKWEGKTFKDLTEKEQFKLETAIMRATIIQQLNPNDKSSIYHIFERLNTGGIKLSPMEVRMCVSEGKFVETLKTLNQNNLWKSLLDQKASEHKRSRDKELILRVLALSEKQYIAPMKRFLNEYLEEHKNTSSDILQLKEQKFLQAIKKASWIKEKPFHLDHKRGLNFSLADSVLVALMNSPLNTEDKIRQAYDNLMKDEQYLQMVRKAASSKKRTLERLKIAKEAFSHG